MINIKITVAGQEFSNIEDGILAAAELAISRNIEEKLSSITNEISKSGGYIKIDIQPDYSSVNVVAVDMPKELIDKVNELLK